MSANESPEQFDEPGPVAIFGSLKLPTTRFILCFSCIIDVTRSKKLWRLCASYRQGAATEFSILVTISGVERLKYPTIAEDKSGASLLAQ